MRSRSLVLLLLLASLPARASEGEARLFAQGLEDYRKARYVDSLQSFAELLALNPETAFGEKARWHIWEIMGHIKKQEARWALTDDERRRAVALARQRRDARNARRDSLLAELEEVQRKTRENPAGLVEALRGSQTLGDAGQVSEARELEALEVQRYMDTIRAALKAQVQQGGQEDPAALHEARAFLWMYEGDLQSAVKEWREALALRPTDQALKERLAKAEKDLETQKRRDDAAYHLSQGKGRLEDGDDAGARESFGRVLSADPDNAEALKLKSLADQRLSDKRRRAAVDRLLDDARQALSSGRLLDAVALLAEALGEDPKNEDARRALAEAKRKLSLKTAIAAPRAPAPKSAPNRAEAEEAYTLGMARYVQDDLRGAVSFFEKALALDSTFEEASGALQAARKEMSLR